MFDLPIVYHPIYDLFSDQESRFPTGKYQELRSVLEVSKILSKKNLFVPRRVEFDTISLTHDQSYVSRVLNCSLSAKEKREIGLSNIDHFSERAVFSAGGTLLAAELALNFGVAANAAGGSHHANFSKGSGFCIFNDVAIAVNCLLKNGKVKNVLILDLDVHQGDGTAELFESDSRVFTVSVHCQKNFPVKKAESDLDVGLEAAVNDDDYIKTIDKVFKAIREVPADLIVYNAGVDIHKNDQLGYFDVSDAGLIMREKKVLDFVKEKKVPFVVTLGGGYQKNVAKLGDLHSMIFKEIVSQFL